jgi:hypothetical protein
MFILEWFYVVYILGVAGYAMLAAFFAQRIAGQLELSQPLPVVAISSVGCFAVATVASAMVQRCNGLSV